MTHLYFIVWEGRWERILFKIARIDTEQSALYRILKSAFKTLCAPPNMGMRPPPHHDVMKCNEKELYTVVCMFTFL